MQKKPFLIIILLFMTNAIYAQIVPVRVVIPAACHQAQIGNTTWAGTVGEPCILTVSNSTTLLTQGFNQPDGYKIIPQTPYVQDITIYPNPAKPNSTLRFYLKADKPAISIQIFDALGKLYSTHTLYPYAGQTWHSLNPQIMAAGTYFVKIISPTEAYAGKFVITAN